MGRMPLPRTAPAPLPDAAAAPHELRREPRLSTLSRTAKLLSGAGEMLCRIRNISSNGFMADACPAPSAGESIALEMCEGRRHSARVVWAQGERFGAEFLVPRAVSEMLDDGRRGSHQADRAFRLSPRDGSATIFHGDGMTSASIVNISQTGMAVFAYGLDLSTDSGRQLQIEIDGLDGMAGLLCWACHGAAGIQFERPLSFETLSHWLWATSLATGPVSSARRIRRLDPFAEPAGAIPAAADRRPRRTSG